MIEKIIYFLQYGFVQNALVVGVLIALCSSLFGATLVLKRLSYIGDGLSHVAFGAVAIASVLKITNNTAIVLPVTVVAAILLLRIGQNAKIKGDALIAMLSVGSLAVGYLLMNVFSTSSNLAGDVCVTLFGSTSVLTLTQNDLVLTIIMTLVVITIFILSYNRIFSVTFDEVFAKATGINSELYNLLIAVVVAIIIVLAMNLVGALLISALVIFPALSSMRVFKSYRSVIISSVIVSIICATVGILLSIVATTPVGATVVAVNIITFVLFSIFGKLLAK